MNFVSMKIFLNVRLRSDKIISVLPKKIYIFNFNTLETITIFNTFYNPSGIFGISNGDNNNLVFAFPFETQGQVFVGKCFSDQVQELSRINAHNSKIASISINKDGTIIATASNKGTLIRIFTTCGGVKFSEFRRGTKNVMMNCLSFDQNNKLIGCTSNVGTIHVFSIAAIMKILNENSEDKKKSKFDEEPKNSKSLLGKIGGLFNIKHAYLDTERSFAKLNIQEENSLIGFGNENTFFVITMEGMFYKAAYDPKRGGDCFKIDQKNILVDI